MAEGLIRPNDLHKLTEDVEMAKVKEALARKRAIDDEQGQMRQAFMARDLRPDVRDRLAVALKRAAEQGLREIMVLSFPSSLCTDGGRAINNFEESWPDTLQGWAKRAHEFYLAEMKPLGYRLRAQVLDYPNGNLGQVGIFLAW
jgi:hypothetical protein